jgi:hypothetical protein
MFAGDGKIQYAFTRVVDDISGLPKFVFIGWCGEGVPDKGLFTQHNAEVQRFFKVSSQSTFCL